MKRYRWYCEALVIVGVLLQLCVGPVTWDALAWPVNGIVLVAFVALLVLMHTYGAKVSALRYLCTTQTAVSALVYAVVLTTVMGLTRQTEDGGWLRSMLTFWPFVLIYAYLDFILGLTILRQLKAFHLGLFIVLTAATLGSADVQRLKMMAVEGQPEWRAMDSERRIFSLPMGIELKRFIMETHDNGAPKRYASDVEITTSEGKHLCGTVEVNHPLKVEGWSIYQIDYDMAAGAQSRVSILELVRDPWLPFVYVGIALMLLGALSLVRYTRWSYKHLLPVGILVAVALACVSYLMPVIRSTQLVPALQSPWFYPHIIMYIVYYSLMGVVAVMALWTLLRGPQSEGRGQTIANLVYVGLTFMTFGMLFGALWAKEAWGDYWAWDPKEMWAAITWFAYLVYIHYRRIPYHSERLALVMLIVAFVLLQMCWWGIKFLPSAQGMSIHVYSS